MPELKYRESATPVVPVSTTVKGAPLTNAEVDGNFKSIADSINQTNNNLVDTAIAYAIVLG